MLGQALIWKSMKGFREHVPQMLNWLQFVFVKIEEGYVFIGTMNIRMLQSEDNIQFNEVFSGNVQIVMGYCLPMASNRELLLTMDLRCPCL